METDNSNKSGNFFLGFFLGGILGSILIFLLGTKEGKKLAEKILERLEEFEEDTEKKMSGLSEKSEKISDLIVKDAEIVKEAIEEKIKRGKDNIAKKPNQKIGQFQGKPIGLDEQNSKKRFFKKTRKLSA